MMTTGLKMMDDDFLDNFDNEYEDDDNDDDDNDASWW